MNNLVLEPRELRMLDGLRLNPRKSFAGKVRGERLTKKKGVSIDFADYREYSDGDDLRHLDWNVLARLDTPVMRTYQDEEDLAVHLLVDMSASMNFGDPLKIDQARRIACALGYVGLIGGDAVIPRCMSVREAHGRTLRGRVAFPRLAHWIQLPRPETSSEGLAASVRQFLASTGRVGLVGLITDGLDPELPSLIRALGARGHEVWFIQILSDVELDPDIEGDLRLIDSESGRTVEVTANSYVLKEYRRRLAEHNAALVEAIRRIGGRHTLVNAASPLDQVIKQPWKREGWLA